LHFDEVTKVRIRGKLQANVKEFFFTKRKLCESKERNDGEVRNGIYFFRRRVFVRPQQDEKKKKKK
jgi:hypothetical protein